MLALFLDYKEKEQSLSGTSTITSVSLTISSIALSRIFQFNDGVMIGLVLLSFLLGSLVKSLGLKGANKTNN